MPISPNLFFPASRISEPFGMVLFTQCSKGALAPTLVCSHTAGPPITPSHTLHQSNRQNPPFPRCISLSVSPFFLLLHPSLRRFPPALPPHCQPAKPAKPASHLSIYPAALPRFSVSCKGNCFGTAWLLLLRPVVR
mmetsp:Transcript_49721/g.105881  ORF Transcript_49721/g.105881 Transcript_49721/m.105881 type:complete len:136 (+) Transcript_49721:36-443(+)